MARELTRREFGTVAAGATVFAQGTSRARTKRSEEEDA
jgi:hypothetical protein